MAAPLRCHEHYQRNDHKDGPKRFPQSREAALVGACCPEKGQRDRADDERKGAERIEVTGDSGRKEKLTEAGEKVAERCRKRRGGEHHGGGAEGFPEGKAEVGV